MSVQVKPPMVLIDQEEWDKTQAKGLTLGSQGPASHALGYRVPLPTVNPKT